MDFQEKVLYHQIHPAKLFTDISTALLSLYLLWKHRIGAALLVMFVPPVCVSFVLIRRADLDRYRRSRLGSYIRQYMTHMIEAVRFTGMAMMAVGAWFHRLDPLGAETRTLERREERPASAHLSAHLHTRSICGMPIL
jgi:hypothetical protein